MSVDTAGAAGLLDRARALDPVIRANADEMEEVRRLPAKLAGKMAEAGIFRMVLPAYLGGMELNPREIVETVEALAIANASAGWCAMIGATTAMNAAYMDRETAAEVYASPDIITGGVFAPMGRATDEGEHYRVTGRWQWGSGSANCTWLCGGCFITGADGELVRGADGAPENRMMIFPAGEAELLDTWHVAGLKGTGSGDIEVKDILVPKARSVSLANDAPVADGALYKFPAFGLLALGVSAVALGNARGALDSLIELAQAKKSQGSSKTLSERQIVQSEVAQLEAAWRSARAYLMDEIDQTWAAALAEGDIPVQRRADLRLACSNMTRIGADICRQAYDIGGGAALFLNNDLQRRFRDAHAATQHIVTARATYELVGRTILGLPTNAAMI